MSPTSAAAPAVSPGAGGRGDRRLALAILISSAALGLVCWEARTVPLAEIVERTHRELTVDRKLPVERSLRRTLKSSRSLVRDDRGVPDRSD